MPRYVTIKENRTFSRLYRKGKSFVSPVLVTYVLRGRSYDNLYPGIRKGYEIIFVARAKTPYVKTQDVEKAMRYHLKQAGIFDER